MSAGCDVYWGSHGCHREHGHDGDCWCDCCECKSHPDKNSGCVAGPPYYGRLTVFYGDDAAARGLNTDYNITEPCAKCGEPIGLDGPDPCLGMIEGVWSACCGHGVVKDAYVCFRGEPSGYDGPTLRGRKAVRFFATETVPRPSTPTS